MLSIISISEDEEQDQHDLDIDIECQENLDPDPTPIPNHRPKWAQNLIEEARNVAGGPDDRIRTRYQY